MDPTTGQTPPLRDLIERVRCAADAGHPLYIRGGNSKDFYGGPPAGEPLDTCRLRGITSYEPSELVVTALAGTPLAELEALLAGKGQCLPFEPPRLGAVPAGTAGGMVAAGLAGPARASVGSVRDYVLGATLINGRGEVLRFGGQVMKNVAGYDVSRILAGSLGVLGVIAEVSLKVLPLPPAQATLEFPCSQAEALRMLNEWGGQPLPLNASCWMSSESTGSGNGTLYVRLRGAGAAVESACARLGGERSGETAAQAIWDACRDHHLPLLARRDGTDLWRVSVPQAAPVLMPDTAPIVEWHGAQRWYRLPAGQAQRVREAAHAAGGHATLFAAADPATPTPRFDALSAPLERIHRALKREFDPRGIFNPGRLYADL